MEGILNISKKMMFWIFCQAKVSILTMSTDIVIVVLQLRFWLQLVGRIYLWVVLKLRDVFHPNISSQNYNLRCATTNYNKRTWLNLNMTFYLTMNNYHGFYMPIATRWSSEDTQEMISKNKSLKLSYFNQQKHFE